MNHQWHHQRTILLLMAHGEYITMHLFGFQWATLLIPSTQLVLRMEHGHHGNLSLFTLTQTSTLGSIVSIHSCCSLTISVSLIQTYLTVFLFSLLLHQLQQAQQHKQQQEKQQGELRYLGIVNSKFLRLDSHLISYTHGYTSLQNIHY